jgi:hypothetical protein
LCNSTLIVRVQSPVVSLTQNASTQASASHTASIAILTDQQITTKNTFALFSNLEPKKDKKEISLSAHQRYKGNAHPQA